MLRNPLGSEKVKEPDLMGSIEGMEVCLAKRVGIG